MTLLYSTSAQTKEQVTFTVVYDNYKFADPYIGDWGFSCLIEGKDKTILFDTGTKPDIFKKNLENLNIDINKIDLIVISHNHGDHTGGLPVILDKRKDLPLYIPASVENKFLERFHEYQGHTIPVTEPIELCDGAYLTGEMGSMIKEQSLLVETEKGLVIVTGCSHQGVENIVKKATQLSDEKIYLLFGGFHLLRHSDKEIKNIIDIFLSEGVQKCGATHCTGDEAIIMMKEVYGKDFVTIGAGNKIQLMHIVKQLVN
jgi:7,8-dihydropterin-6-yl-methyl-4-(beta-D-ribofuranosyl)aminobenzene 5'-phosphate synthase